MIYVPKFIYSSEMKMQQGASERRVYKREAHTQATSNNAASSFPMSIGHRGAAGFAPENTLAAMRVAKQCGAQMVEFDVKQTKDGVLVVMHDDNVQRTTNGFGVVADLTFNEIRALDAGSFFDSSFAGEKVPTLMDVLHVLEETEMMANIEIKPCPNTDEILAKNIVQFIQKNWPSSLPLPIVSSFSRESLRVARHEDSAMHIGMLLDNPVSHDWKALARELKACVVSLNEESVTVELVKAIHEEGLLALAYTVNDLPRAKELYSFGIDSIFTDYPGAV